jgi:hypothetical protein
LQDQIETKKPLTWKNTEVKFHSNNIMLITDFGDMDKARDWREKLRQKLGILTDKPTLQIFINGFY